MAIADGNTASSAAVGFSNLPIARQVGLLVGLAATIAIGVATAMWATEPSYSPLYSDLSHRDAGEVMDALIASGIKYKMDSRHGTLLVKSSQIHDARIKLAAQGLPKNSSSGFSFLAEKPGLTTSQYSEMARHRYGLEKELAKTIGNFKYIKKARVHLAIPKQSAFIRNKRKPTGSVFVDLYSGYRLDAGQVSSIVHLIASSVPGMSSNSVTVVDETGRLLNNSSSGDQFSVANKMLNYKSQVEKNYINKIQDLLVPILGEGRVKARVNAKLNFTRLEKTRESYNPDNSVVRSEQVVEENQMSGQKAEGGIPGALSNQPPTDATLINNAQTSDADPQAVARKQQSGNKRQQTIRNYELDKTISHTSILPGKIERLTVAVVVDDLRSYDAESKEVIKTPLKEKELEEITALVKVAIGFDEKRGDSVKIINRTFAMPEPIEALPGLSFWQQGWFWDVIKHVFGGILVLILIFAVFLPILRNLATRSVTSLPNAGEGNAAAGGGSAGGQATDLRLPGPLQTYEDGMQVVKNMAANDPKRVAQVVKTWVDDS